jgi:hypothetical protein
MNLMSQTPAVRYSTSKELKLRLSSIEVTGVLLPLFTACKFNCTGVLKTQGSDALL